MAPRTSTTTTTRRANAARLSAHKAPLATRGYSRAFPQADGTGKRYLVDNIPPALWRAVKAQAKRDGRSIRNIVLTAFDAYVDAAK
jgi:hypothetical protein